MGSNIALAFWRESNSLDLVAGISAMTSYSQSWRRWSVLAGHVQVAVERVAALSARSRSSILAKIQLCTSLSTQPTQRPTRGTGLGKSPEPMSLYMVDLAKPVNLTTSLRRMILKMSPLLTCTAQVRS